MRFSRVLLLRLLPIAVLGLLGCQSHPKHEITKVVGPSGNAAAEEFQRQGDAFLAKGKTAEAQHAFEQAIEADRGFGPAHNNLGKILLQQKHLYQAAWEFEAACKIMPNRPEPENNIGMVYEEAGKLELAITHYTKALSLAPDNSEILGNLVRAKVRRGDKDDALKEQLNELVLKDSRPEWIGWAKEKLAIIAGIRADPSPRNVLPKPEPSNILVPIRPEDRP